MPPPTRLKGFMELRTYPLDMTALFPVGETLSSVQVVASLMNPPFPLQPATFAAPVVIGDPTVQLNASVNPGKGALVIAEPGTGVEERWKVKDITGGPTTWTATIDPVAWAPHNTGAGVSYEPGRSLRLLISDTPTPSGMVVPARIQKGAYGQKYRVSYLAIGNTSGQHREDEFTLEVTDIAAVDTNIKQPTEEPDIAGLFEKVMNEPHQAGATLSSATAYVSANLNTATAQLTAQANPGAATILMNQHPGVGAMLILTPAGTGSNPPERVYVSAVSGTVSPFTVTLAAGYDLEFTHSTGADVTIYQGYSGAFLVSPTSTILGQAAVNRARRGQAGKALKVVWLAPTSQSEVLQVTGIADLQEV